MALTVKNPWTSQPQVPVGIDWGNPITRGLLIGALPEGATMRNMVNGERMTTSGVPTGVVTSDGRAFKTVLASSQYGYFNLNISTGPATILIRHVLNDAGFQVVAALDTVSSTPRAVLIYGQTAGNYSTSVTTASGAGDGLIAASTGTPASAAIRIDVAQRSQVFANGVAGTATTGTWTASGTNALHISCRVNTTPGVFASQSVMGAFAWKRALSDAEIKSVSANPWQIFAPLQRRIWIPTAGGGTFLSAWASRQTRTIGAGVI